MVVKVVVLSNAVSFFGEDLGAQIKHGVLQPSTDSLNQLGMKRSWSRLAHSLRRLSYRLRLFDSCLSSWHRELDHLPYSWTDILTDGTPDCLAVSSPITTQVRKSNSVNEHRATHHIYTSSNYNIFIRRRLTTSCTVSLQFSDASDGHLQSTRGNTPSRNPASRIGSGIREPHPLSERQNDLRPCVCPPPSLSTRCPLPSPMKYP